MLRIDVIYNNTDNYILQINIVKYYSISLLYPGIPTKEKALTEM